MRKVFSTTAVSFALAAAIPAQAAPMTIDNIIELTNVGLDDEAIIAKIRSERAVFELSTDQMIAMKKKGVSSAVIAAMINPITGGASAMSMDSPDWRVPHPSGVYLLQSNEGVSRMVRIDPTVSSQAKTGGIIGYALTGGLASMSIKVSIANESARLATGGATKFFMFFDESNGPNGSGVMSSGANAVATSPSEFTLVKLTRKKGRRESRVGSTNMFGSKAGIMDKDRLPFTSEMQRPGVYRIDIPTLSAGEYAFVFPIAGGGTGGAMSAKLFDFAVR